MSKIIAIANQKGGTAKTTTTINLAGALAELGYKILVTDIDPQGSLGIGFGVDVSQLEKNMYDVLVQGEEIKPILHSVREQIDLAPANIFLSVAEIHLAGEIRREDRLKNALESIQDQYDFVLIDCPPSLGLLTINAFSATNHVLIPMSCDYYSMVGVKLLLDTVSKIQIQLNPNLAILGIVATRFDSRTAHSKEVLEEARAKLSQYVKVFKTVIRETVRLKEAPIVGMTITEYRDKHPAADDYRQLAQEVLNEYK